MAENREMLHQGQVTERDVNSASARVSMDDLGGYVSGRMQILFPAIGGWNIFYTPKEGDHVVSARLPNGQEEGYILGKVYTGNKMPQGGAPNIFLMISDNGKNVVRFDADKGTLDVICDQVAKIKAKNFEMEIKEDITEKADGSITREAGGNISEKSGGNTTHEAGGKYAVTAPQIEHSGAVKATGGSFECGGEVAPTGQGALCGCKFCYVTGAPVAGSKAEGT